MPLQWLNLQQRQQQPQRSVVSQALTPQPQRKGFAEAGGNMPNRFVEEQKAKWAEEDKLRKMERDAKVNEAQEMGMRIRDAYDKEKAQGRAMSAQAQGQQGKASTAAPLTKENMPKTVKTMWEFISTLEPESQKFYINQLKQKEYGGAASTISLTNEPYDPENDTVVEDPQSRQIFVVDKNGKKKMVILQGGSGMYAEMVKQGLLNPETDEIIQKKGEQDWVYNAEDNLMWNKRTSETKPMKGTKLEGVSPDLIADAFKYGSAHMGRLMNPTLLEKISPENMSLYIENARKEAQLATMNYLLGMGISKKEAKDIAYSIPIGERETTKTEPSPTTEPTRTGVIKNWDAPLDEEKAKGFAEFLKANPNTTSAMIEANRDKYGDATVDRALEILGEETKTTVKKTKKKEVVKKEEPKVKDYLKGMMERRGLE